MTNTNFNDKKKIVIGLADDEQIFLLSLGMLINSFAQFTVSVEALNGEQLIKKLDVASLFPDILLIDVKMPVLNGINTAKLISEKYPLVKLVALSTQDDDVTVISMLKAGCCAYLLKDIHATELEKALLEIYTNGYYNADAAQKNHRRLLLHQQKKEANWLTEKELNFLKLACTELTYKQIAAEMHKSERTIDGYRESVFEKLNVESRVGMALEAIRRKLVEL